VHCAVPIVEQTIDAIIATRADDRMCSSPRLERMFRCETNLAAGQPLDRFLLQRALDREAAGACSFKPCGPTVNSLPPMPRFRASTSPESRCARSSFANEINATSRRRVPTRYRGD
jgi:hypothetical protein